MSDTCTPPSALPPMARPPIPAGLEDLELQNHGPKTLRSLFAAWQRRVRFRWELEQKSKDNPHLIEDIGLTRRQVAAEIAKPFWQE